MALTQDQKNRLGQCLARLVPNFDGKVLAYKDYFVDWRDSRPQPSEDEIVAEYEKLIAEEKAKEQKEIEKETARKEIKLLPPNASLAEVIEAINKLNLVNKHPEPSSDKPSNAVRAKIIIGGKKE